MIYPLSRMRKEAGAWQKIFQGALKRFPKLTVDQATRLTNQHWGHKLTEATEKLLKSRAARGNPEAVRSLELFESPAMRSTKHHYLPLQNVRNPSHWRNQPNSSGPTVTPQAVSTWMQVIKNPPKYYDGSAQISDVRGLLRGDFYRNDLYGKLFKPTVRDVAEKGIKGLK